LREIIDESAGNRIHHVLVECAARRPQARDDGALEPALLHCLARHADAVAIGHIESNCDAFLDESPGGFRTEDMMDEDVRQLMSARLIRRRVDEHQVWPGKAEGPAEHGFGVGAAVPHIEVDASGRCAAKNPFELGVRSLQLIGEFLGIDVGIGRELKPEVRRFNERPAGQRLRVCRRRQQCEVPGKRYDDRSHHGHAPSTMRGIVHGQPLGGTRIMRVTRGGPEALHFKIDC
jgi:hypothetical protein